MPNSINRRRTSVENGSSDEIEKLKQELKSLKELYAEDMANVSADMRNLNSQISSNSSPDTSVLDTPTSLESGIESTPPSNLIP